MPSRFGLFILLAAIAAGAFFVLVRVFFPEVKLLSFFARARAIKGEAKADAIEKDALDRLIVDKKREICPRCGEYRHLVDNLPQKLRHKYSKLCVYCINALMR